MASLFEWRLFWALSMKSNVKIGFLGSMNSMPMTYALKFKGDGFDVRYVVESDSDNYLMRPEHQYPKLLSYPYPEWIVEIPWVNNLINYGLLPYSNRAAVDAMADRDVIFLNDYGIALAPWLPKHSIKVALSSGGDIDQTCDWSIVPSQARAALPGFLRPLWWLFSIRRTLIQRRGLRLCSAVSYFPEGLNPSGDDLLQNLVPQPPWKIIPRYDVSFHAVGTSLAETHRRQLTEILVGVRFKINTVKGAEIEYKGNDIILRALSVYRRRNPSVKIHLIRKGDAIDIQAAEKLCEELDISGSVIWHEPMPLESLFDLYRQSDVCIDQVGSHWMGAIGCYALHLGRPLIANARPEVMERFWGEKSPVLNAVNESQIVNHLIDCEDPCRRALMGFEGNRFASMHLDVGKTYEKLKDFVVASTAKKSKCDLFFASAD